MTETNTVLRLIPKKKKGLLRLIFSRLGMIVMLIIFQLAIFVSLYVWADEYFTWFNGAIRIFAVVMVLYLFNIDMDSTAKLTWLNLIMLFPIPASLFFWFTQREIGHRAEKALVQHAINESRERIPQETEVIYAPDLVNSGTDDLCRYVNRSGCFPIYRGTQVQYFPSGEEKFAALVEELKKAERFIFLEYFIIDEGYMWGTILKILADKAAQGVEVRLLYDGMCEVNLLPHDYPKRLERLGIKAKAFSPISPFISTTYNYRDHRKILVIDGKTAFNGGVNLADEYINARERFGHWKDTAVMLKGKAVRSFTLMFLQMWNIGLAEPEWEKWLDTVYEVPTDGYVMPYGDHPLDNDKVGENVYMDILSRARSYVHIMTPYLILDGELEAALKYAAQRGVDVKIILPGIPDKKLAYSLAKAHYKSLISAGVKIYEYTPGFVHAKVFVSDDEKAVVGTINLDYRSLYHHFECATYLYRTSCISQISTDFNTTLTKCRQVTPDSIRKEKLYYKITGSIMKLLAPLM